MAYTRLDLPPAWAVLAGTKIYFVLSLIMFAYTYYCFYCDKKKAERREPDRTPEEKLMTLTLLAPFAAHFAMKNLRHKTKKWYFKTWSNVSMGIHVIFYFIMCHSGHKESTINSLTMISLLIYAGMIKFLPKIQISHGAAVTPAPVPTRPGPPHNRRTTGGFITQGRRNNPQILGQNRVLGATFRRGSSGPQFYRL